MDAEATERVGGVGAADVSAARKAERRELLAVEEHVAATLGAVAWGMATHPVAVVRLVHTLDPAGADANAVRALWHAGRRIHAAGGLAAFFTAALPTAAAIATYWQASFWLARALRAPLGRPLVAPPAPARLAAPAADAVLDTAIDAAAAAGAAALASPFLAVSAHMVAALLPAHAVGPAVVAPLGASSWRVASAIGGAAGWDALFAAAPHAAAAAATVVTVSAVVSRIVAATITPAAPRDGEADAVAETSTALGAFIGDLASIPSAASAFRTALAITRPLQALAPPPTVSHAFARDTPGAFLDHDARLPHLLLSLARPFLPW